MDDLGVPQYDLWLNDLGNLYIYIHHRSIILGGTYWIYSWLRGQGPFREAYLKKSLGDAIL